MEDKNVSLIKSWYTNHKEAIVVAVVAIVVLIGFYCSNKPGTEKAPAIIPVTDTSPAQIRQASPNLSTNEAREVSRRIDVVTHTQPPTVQYYTATQTAADDKAQALAKQDKADQVYKQTKVVPVQGSDQSVIQNDYYAVQMGKKHDIKAGAAVIDSQPYATISYRNRDVTYEAYYNPATKKGGAGVSVTVASW